MSLAYTITPAAIYRHLVDIQEFDPASDRAEYLLSELLAEVAHGPACVAVVSPNNYLRMTAPLPLLESFGLGLNVKHRTDGTAYLFVKLADAPAECFTNTVAPMRVQVAA